MVRCAATFSDAIVAVLFMNFICQDETWHAARREKQAMNSKRMTRGVWNEDESRSCS
jgi:hypothetical protein